MNKRKIIAIFFILIGLILILNSFSGMTGFAVAETISKGFSGILGLVFIIGGVLFFIGRKNLERIIKKEGYDLNEIEKNRDLFLDKNSLNYQIRTGKNLSENFTPLVDYNGNNAIEYIERYKNSPKYNSRRVSGNKYISLPVKINWGIKDEENYNLPKRLTEKYTKNSVLWDAANQRIFRLSGGHLGDYNFVSKTGKRYLYLRDVSRGARVFLERLNNNEYNLIGVVSGEQKKVDEDKMIKWCIDQYNNKVKNITKSKI